MQYVTVSYSNTISYEIERPSIFQVVTMDITKITYFLLRVCLFVKLHLKRTFYNLSREVCMIK